MNNYMSTIISGIRTWTESLVNRKISNIKTEMKDNTERFQNQLTYSTADYEQNDSSALNHIKHRPFYDYYEDYDETFENLSTGYGGYVEIPIKAIFTIGEEYSITVCGNTYRATATHGEYNGEVCLSWEIPEFDNAVVMIVQWQDVAPDDIPYATMYDFPWDYLINEETEELPSIVINIQGSVHQFKPLDRKYYDDTPYVEKEVEIARDGDTPIVRDLIVSEMGEGYAYRIGTTEVYGQYKNRKNYLELTSHAVVRGINDPEEDYDAANKGYVGQEIKKPKTKFNLLDKVTGEDYIVEIRDGEIVSRRQPVSSYISKQPDNLHHLHGIPFDLTGLKVMNRYADGTETETVDYDVVPQIADYDNPTLQIHALDTDEYYDLDITVCPRVYNYFPGKMPIDETSVGTTQTISIYPTCSPSSVQINPDDYEFTIISEDENIASAEFIDNTTINVSINGLGETLLKIPYPSNLSCGHDHSNYNFEEIPVYPVTTPTVDISLSVDSNNIRITGKSDIGVNPDKYYNEVKHGVLYIYTDTLGSRIPTIDTLQITNRVCKDYDSTGSFSYSFKPTLKGLSYTYRAYVCYERLDGSQEYVYSEIIEGSYDGIVSTT